MNLEEFELRASSGSIMISKSGKSFSIEKTLDNDILFGSTNDNLELEISFNSRNRAEWGSYIIFESLMKLIVGRFVLTGDYKDEFCMLPDDFIDLETKTITWHSDSGVDNVLKLQYDEKSIKLFIMKSKNDNVVNTVRIRTDGSSYGYYYQEFEKFFKELYSFALSYSPEVMTPNNESPKRKLLLFGKKTPRK